MTKLDWIKQTFGDFKYTELKGGAIKIDPEWIKANIVLIKSENKFGQISFWGHNKLLTQFNAIMSCMMAKELELDKLLIDRLDFKQSGGCWVARHMLWKADKPLSFHSWGIAIDCNVKKSMQEKSQPIELVKIFEDNGFEWGGKWKSWQDWMHFECSMNIKFVVKEKE